MNLNVALEIFKTQVTPAVGDLEVAGILYGFLHVLSKLDIEHMEKM